MSTLSFVLAVIIATYSLIAVLAAIASARAVAMRRVVGDPRQDLAAVEAARRAVQNKRTQ